MDRDVALGKIKTLGSSYIKTPSVRVKRWQNLDGLFQDMNEVADHANAAGLAANQIGVKARVILLRVGKPQFILNPEITKRSVETETDWEGCLSIPGYKAQVERSKFVTLEGYDKNWKKIKIKADGLLARAIQHEVDHACFGKVYIDGPHYSFIPVTEEVDEDNA